MDKQEKITSIESQLNELYAIRNSSDDAALKCVKEGLVFAEKYPALAEQRRAVAPQIEALEAELEQVKAMPDEEEVL